MSATPHIVETKWREADTASWQERVVALNCWLDHTEDITEMLEEDGEMVTALQSLSGLVRARRNDIEQTVGKLQAQIEDRAVNRNNSVN